MKKFSTLASISCLLCCLLLVGLLPPAHCNVQAAAFRPRQETATATVAQQQPKIKKTQQLSSPSSVLSSESSLSKTTRTPPRGGAAVIENTVANAVAGSVMMALIEVFTKKSFKALGIKFPGQLGGCLVLFIGLLLLECVNADLANSIFNALSPGSALLAKWLPVFFIPGLAMLPLAPPIGDASEVLKVLSVVLIGWFYTICTTGFTVLTLRTALGTVAKTVPAAAAAPTTAASPASPPPKPFLDSTVKMLLQGAVLFGVLSVVVTRVAAAGGDKGGLLSTLATPIQSAFFGLATTAAYVWGARLPAAFTKVVHPLVTACCILLTLVQLLGSATDRTFLDVLRTFKTGSLSPMKAGAGDILLYLLGPSVVSFAVSMYSRRQLLKKNLLVVAVAMLVSSVGGLFGTAAFVRLISLGGPDGSMVRLSVLSRNVTTALAMAVTELLGGDIAIAASVVVMTGILGATYGKTFLTALNIMDPVTRGLAVGSSSQGLGVASIANEVDAFPFAAISMVLTAISATTMVSVPAIREALISLATGK